MAEWRPKDLFTERDVEIEGEVVPILNLEMKDRNGKEYHDGHIVRVNFRGHTIAGFIRYFAGRFEIVCPFREQRFVFGLNPEHEIIGHFSTDMGIIESQERRPFTS